MKEFWAAGFHDTDSGRVTGLCLSYDERFMFSIGSDSNIFGLLFNVGIEELDRARADNRIRVGLSSGMPKEVNDIDDSSAYSIEQAKLKSETDKMLAIAESKKQEMRGKITQLRKSFKDLLLKNDLVLPRLRLKKKVSLFKLWT